MPTTHLPTVWAILWTGLKGVPVQWGPTWTCLNMSRGRGSVQRGTRPCTVGVDGHGPFMVENPVNRQTDPHTRLKTLPRSMQPVTNYNGGTYLSKQVRLRAWKSLCRVYNQSCINNVSFLGVTHCVLTIYGCSRTSRFSRVPFTKVRIFDQVWESSWHKRKSHGIIAFVVKPNLTVGNLLMWDE